jgi:hypothetical protein
MTTFYIGPERLSKIFHMEADLKYLQLIELGICLCDSPANILHKRFAVNGACTQHQSISKIPTYVTRHKLQSGVQRTHVFLQTTSEI